MWRFSINQYFYCFVACFCGLITWKDLKDSLLSKWPSLPPPRVEKASEEWVGTFSSSQHIVNLLITLPHSPAVWGGGECSFTAMLRRRWVFTHSLAVWGEGEGSLTTVLSQEEVSIHSHPCCLRRKWGFTHNHPAWGECECSLTAMLSEEKVSVRSQPCCLRRRWGLKGRSGSNRGQRMTPESELKHWLSTNDSWENVSNLWGENLSCLT